MDTKRLRKFALGDRVTVNAEAYEPGLAGMTGVVFDILDGVNEPPVYGIILDGIHPTLGDWVDLSEHKLDRAANPKSLSPQAVTVRDHIAKQGDISAVDAILTYGMTSATLARRVCDLEDAGYIIARKAKRHPTTGRRYTRYAFAD